MKFFISLLAAAFVFSSCSTDLTEEERKKMLKIAEHEIHEIMEDMDLPEYGIVQMVKRDEILTKDFQKASADMIKYGRQMKDVKHPDAKFNQFNDEMLDAFDHFEEALKTKDKAKILASWKAVDATCKKCHDAYE